MAATADSIMFSLIAATIIIPIRKIILDLLIISKAKPLPLIG